MGHHFTTPAPSCKEQNSQGEEMTASFNNFTNYFSYITTGKAGGLLGERLSSANGEGADKTESRPRRPYSSPPPLTKGGILKSRDRTVPS
jgi:hypothetical protein